MRQSDAYPMRCGSARVRHEESRNPNLCQGFVLASIEPLNPVYFALGSVRDEAVPA